MGLLDSDTVIVDAILTKLGRDKLRQGQPLGISQYAFGDTGVDSYGSAITALPQLEAVPDDDVFLRSKLYGDGERGIQNFGFVDLPDGTTRTIQHIPKGIESTAIEIKPRVYSAGTEIPNTTFKFTILVATVNGVQIVGNAFLSATVDKRSAVGPILTLNAQPGQIEREVTRSVLIELEGGGAAPTTVNVTVQPNTDVNSTGVGQSA